MCYQMIVIWWGIWEDGGKDAEKTNDKSSLGKGDSELSLKGRARPSLGLSLWLSGKESACQCRRHGFNP